MASTATETAIETETSTTKKLEDVSDSYKSLLSKLNTLAQLERCQAVLRYDQLVWMPPKAAPERGAQMAVIAALAHEKSTEPEIKELIEKSQKDLEEHKESVEGGEDTLRLLELEYKSFCESERVPPELAAKAASLSAIANAAWVKSKTEDDFASFAPVLRDCFDTAMELAKAKRDPAGDNQDASLYNEMLDTFERGMPAERIEEIFAKIETALVALIQNVLKASHSPDSSITTISEDNGMDKTIQKELAEAITTKLGYDISRGRVDTSPHPFTMSISSMDVRFSSIFSETEWIGPLRAAIHESGHAMYEQNLGTSSTSIDKALSLGMHESQSLFWERQIGLSLPFWNFALPMFHEKFPSQFPASITPETIYSAINTVTPSLIRVEADELTYPLHVILRYRLERDVVDGKLEVTDISQRWKDDMKSMLDVDVPNDTKGCLQDIHWSTLAFGYFPTYLIGAATAAQLYHFCQKDLPDIENMIEKGDFAPIKAWLTDKVHRHGSRYKSLDEHLEDQLGEKLNPDYYIQYLTKKYSALYKLE